MPHVAARSPIAVLDGGLLEGKEAMVALRKDVKVGLIVGGITLAVVAVYVGLSALSSGPAAKDAAPVADITQQPSPTDASDASSVARTDPRPPTPSAGAPQGTANAAPTTPAALAQQPKPAGNSDDVWSNAFNHGSVQPSVTVTPSLNNPSREPAAKPSDVIQALQNPKPPAQNTTAAAGGDTNGSLAVNSPTATLTRGNAATQPTAAAVAGGTTYVVKPGDTFSSIAAEHYGDRNLYKVIETANPGVDSGRMKPGVSLTLPPRDAVAKRAAPAASAAANVDPARQYVVKPGDSLESIASALYNERGKWQSIYDANKAAIGDSPARLKVGTVLTLPAAPTKK